MSLLRPGVAARVCSSPAIIMYYCSVMVGHSGLPLCTEPLSPRTLLLCGVNDLDFTENKKIIHEMKL